MSPSGTAASPGPGRRAPGAGEPGCTSRSGAAGWPSAQVRRLSGEGPLPPPRGVFRFPGVLMCAGGSSETQERYTDPANDLGAQAVLPLRHLRGARAGPAKESGKSAGSLCAPPPLPPAEGARGVRSGFAHVAAAHFRLCLLSSLHLSRVRLQAAPPRSHCRALPPSRPLCAPFCLPRRAPVCISGIICNSSTFLIVKDSLPVWPFLSAQFGGISYIWTLVTHRHLHPPQLLVSPQRPDPSPAHSPSLLVATDCHCPDPDPSPCRAPRAQSVLLGSRSVVSSRFTRHRARASISCVIKAE